MLYPEMIELHIIVYTLHIHVNINIKLFEDIWDQRCDAGEFMLIFVFVATSRTDSSYGYPFVSFFLMLSKPDLNQQIINLHS